MIQSDADLSHPPELLPRMIELLQVCPVVIGSRYVAGGGAKNWNLSRRFLSFGANLYARTLTGVPVHALLSDPAEAVGTLRLLRNPRAVGQGADGNFTSRQMLTSELGLRIDDHKVFMRRKHAGPGQFTTPKPVCVIRGVAVNYFWRAGQQAAMQLPRKAGRVQREKGQGRVAGVDCELPRASAGP